LTPTSPSPPPPEPTSACPCPAALRHVPGCGSVPARLQVPPGVRATGCTSFPSGAYDMTCSACLTRHLQGQHPQPGLVRPCERGSYASGNASLYCDDCPLGTSGIGQGQASCPLCREGFYASNHIEIISGCVPCPFGMTTLFEGSQSTGSCRCLPGNTPLDVLVPLKGCRACHPGQYKPGVSNLQCSSCDFNTYQPEYGAVSSTSCLPCPNHSLSLSSTGSIEGCICESGYERVGEDTCSPCSPGSYKPSLSNAEVCVPCWVGYFSEIPASSFCTPLHSRRSIHYNRDQCIELE
jgi:hypothetical protein